MGGSFSSGGRSKDQPKQSGRTFVNGSDKDQNDYETDMYSSGNLDAHSGRRDLLIYLFGEDTDGMKIVSWDPVKHQLKHKRVPANFEIRNYPGCIQLADNKICVAGGINKDLNKITNKFYIYNPVTDTVVEKSPMKQIRYTFPLIAYHERLYAIGGRIYGGDDVSLLNKCERYDLFSNEWTEICPMHQRRCTAMTFLYKDQLWVFGGYTAHLKRSSLVERFVEEEDRWEKIEFRLYQGFEAGHVFALAPNKILVVGGKIYGGECNYVHEIDLHEGTILNKAPLTNARVLSKSAVTVNGKFVVIGGNRETDPTCEELDLNTMTWRTPQVNNIRTITNWKCMGYSTYPTTIPYDPLQKPSVRQTLDDYSNMSVIFGTDDEPFIIEINKTNMHFQVRPCPLKLKLKNYQGVCRIAPNLVFIGGGINRELKKIFTRCYIYDLKDNVVQKCKNLKSIRYTFPAVFCNNYVYVIGGRQYGTDENAVVNMCERMDVNTLEWTKIASLNYPRCTSMTFIINTKVYVAGGFFTNGRRVDSIEVYDDVKNNWMMLGLSLPTSLEASVCWNNDNKVYFIGGRENSGDTATILKADLDEPADISEIKTIGHLNKKRCLHKGLSIGDTVWIVGGAEFDSIEVLNRYTMAPEHTDMVKRLQGCLESVTYNNFFLKKCSNA